MDLFTWFMNFPKDKTELKSCIKVDQDLLADCFYLKDFSNLKFENCQIYFENLENPEKEYFCQWKNEKFYNYQNDILDCSENLNLN